MSERVERIVVVGGSVAAQRCAFELRALGFEGSVELVSAEREPPYDRTLLSKDMLTADEPAACVTLRSPADYADAGIAPRLGTRAVSLDTAARQVTLSDGTLLPYSRLVICTGGRAVLPPALRCPGVLTLREADDVMRVHDALARVRHLIVIGGGFIGCELASAAVARHAPVTLVEAEAAPYASVLGTQVGERIAEIHRAAGVRLECGSPVSRLDRDRDGFRVALADGRVLRADAVVAGVGMTPAVDWLRDTPLTLEDGIVTDSACRTAVPGVLAAGDCARWLHPDYGVRIRVEHWDTAARHGAAAAAGALGGDEPFAPLPFFWSDQHGSKLQWVGYAPRWDEVEIDDSEGPGFLARYRVGGKLAGVLAVDRPRELAAARRELASARSHQQAAVA